MTSIAAVIPAKNEAARLSATLSGIALIEAVDLVVVVDDGSSDDTASVAVSAGAVVVRHDRSRGKGAAMMSGATRVAGDDVAGAAPRHLLFVDADLGASAVAAQGLVVPVLDGSADVVIARFSPGGPSGGGHGFVVRLAGWGLQRRVGWAPSQPLNGQRAMTREAFEAVSPLGRGFGVEVAMTVDAVRRGLRLAEVEVDMSHRVTGSDWRGRAHRARQFAAVGLALAGVRNHRAMRRSSAVAEG